MFRKTIFVLVLAAAVLVKVVPATPIPGEDGGDVDDVSPTSEALLENAEMSTEKGDASTLASAENVDSESSTQRSSTGSRHSIRDFYRRRQKNVDTTAQVDLRPRVAKNQTASEILMQKIRASKDQQKNYFDPAAPGVENSLSQKRKRLVRVRPKFNELAASASTTSSIVTVPPPASASTTATLTATSSAPPLMAATNTLLMWHENKSRDFPSQGSQPNDWSRKKAAASSIISSRLKTFRERKKNGFVSEDKPEVSSTTPGKKNMKKLSGFNLI